MLATTKNAFSIWIGVVAVFMVGTSAQQLAKGADIDSLKALLLTRRAEAAQLAARIHNFENISPLAVPNSPKPACDWSFFGFGYLNCSPDEQVVTDAVVNAIGSKGRFYKPYLQLRQKCGRALYFNNCPAGCVPDPFSLAPCSAQSPYEYFACPGSFAKEWYRGQSCWRLTTPTSCAAQDVCQWSPEFQCTTKNYPPSGIYYILAGAPVDESRLESLSFYNPTANLTAWRQAFGTCPGSTYLFNRQVCSWTYDLGGLDKSDCLKYKQCEWVSDGKGVYSGCIRKKSYLSTIMYGGDPALSKWAAQCFQYDNNPLACIGV